MEHTEIQLVSDIFDVSQLTSQETRENLYLSINQLDVNKLTDLEIRQSFNGIKVALGVFIRKFVELEGEITNVKLQQVAYEAKMERLFLKGQMEIKELKQELTQMRTADRHLEKVVEVAKLLKDNNYAPMAIKSMMNGIASGEIFKDISIPEDMARRVKWAQSQGFRWNKNNRPPTKISKQIKLLETWEMEFYKAKALTPEQLKNKDFVTSIGKGAVAGALMAIEGILGYQLEERKTLSAYNCYQRAIRLLEEIDQEDTTAITTSATTDFSPLVSYVFGDIPEEIKFKIVNGLSKLPKPYSTKQILSQLKIYFSADLLPRFIEITEETNPLKLLPKLQGDYYDNQLTDIIKESLCFHQER
jgi:hypothetical protein